VAEERAITLGVGPTVKAEVRGEQRQLRQVLSNLVDNAIRFTPADGRVDVSVSVDPEHGQARYAVCEAKHGRKVRRRSKRRNSKALRLSPARVDLLRAAPAGDNGPR
jgi:signal transduction histidine kinase